MRHDVDVSGTVDAKHPLKVLSVIARLNVGGAAAHVVLLDRGLRSRGHMTCVVHGSIEPGEASLEGLALDQGVPAQKLSGLGRRVSPLGDLRAFFALLRLTFSEAPDVIHTHTAKAGTLGRLAAAIFNLTRRRRRRCLVVHTYHGHVLTGYFSPWVEASIRWTERALALMTDQVITLSPSQRRDIVERFRVASSAKVVVVPLGLEFDELLGISSSTPTLRQQLAIPPDAMVVGCIGRMVPIKDLPTLVRAFAEVSRRRRDLYLLLAGDGPVRQDLQNEIRELGITDRVRIIGWVSDLPRFYATIDICALSSSNEGTPVALIEGMAAAKPVVATAVGGVPDMVDEGRTGLLVPAGDVIAMARAIERLSVDARARDEIGQAGRQHALALYSHQRLIASMENLYRSGLAHRRTR